MTILEKILRLSQTSLGIEFGSTRIKGVLIDGHGHTIASGEFDWENQFENNIWTYDLKDAWHGLQVVYGQIKEKVEKKYNMKKVVFCILISIFLWGPSVLVQ